MEKFLLISAGAILGANARYWLGDWIAQRWGASFPFGTLIINVTGSLLLGLFMTLATERYLLDPRWRLILLKVSTYCSKGSGFQGYLTCLAAPSSACLP